jgi:hypothetical protein
MIFGGWITDRLEGVDGSLRECGKCLVAGGHVYPPPVLTAERSRSGRSAEEIAASEVEDARERSDHELELRSVLMGLLKQLDEEGGGDRDCQAPFTQLRLASSRRL